MNRNRRIFKTEYNADGLLVAYDDQGRELARGKDGLAIVAALWDRDPSICEGFSTVGGVRRNPDGSWRYQNTRGKIELTGATKAEAEAYGLSVKRQQRKKK